MFDRGLENDLSGEANGELGRIFQSLSQGTRATDGPNYDLARKEAQELYDVSPD